MRASGVKFSDKIDADDELEVMIIGSDEVYAWIDQEDAENIINHLKEVFNID